MVGSLLLRGMLAGLAAGLMAFAFATLIGEPPIERAIAFEAAAYQARGEPPEEELVSREVQRTLGLLTGLVVYGSALGGLFALTFAYASGRVGRIGPRGLSGLLALAGFIAIIVVPALKYPANPPSVGDPATIGHRTGLYFLMLACSIAAALLAARLYRSTAIRFGAWNAALLGAAAFVVLIILVETLLPDVNEVPEAFPAVLLWRFRMASLGIQLVLWSAIGLAFGWLAERKLRAG